MQSARLPSPPPTPNLPPAGPSVTLTGPNAGHDDLHGPSALLPMRRAKTGIPYASLAVTTASFPGDEMADNRTGPQALPKGPTPPHDEYDVRSPLHNLTETKLLVIPPLLPPSHDLHTGSYDDLPDILRQNRLPDDSPRRPMNGELGYWLPTELTIFQLTSSSCEFVGVSLCSITRI
jgi:hypothetical protein